MRSVFNVSKGDVWWAASDIGWVVGHSFMIYGPLIAGAATVMYEGKPVGTPDASSFFRVIEQHNVRGMFTAPTALRAIRKEDPNGVTARAHNLDKLQNIFVAGERCDPPTIEWAEKAFRAPVVDNWWQTETGWPICGNLVGEGVFPLKRGSCGKPTPGFDVRCIAKSDDGIKFAAPNETGAIVVSLPLPPGCFTTLWGNDKAFHDKYMAKYPGFYDTGDAGYVDDDGYVHIMSRTDDVLNVAGHRLSSGALEEALCCHDDVAEAAVVGVRDELKGEIPVGLVVVKSGATTPTAEIEAACVQLVRERIGAVACLKNVLAVVKLPKTRSGKILRATMRKIAEGEEFKTPPTIDDASALDVARDALKRIGLPKGG
jgi:propionyl-CoA synthetase